MPAGRLGRHDDLRGGDQQCFVIRRIDAGRSRRPGPVDHPAIELDVAVHDDVQGELFVDSPACGRTQSPRFNRVFK